MSNNARHSVGVAGAALVMALSGSAAGFKTAQATSATSRATSGATSGPVQQEVSAQGQFYCNAKALSAEERARHTQMTEKLIAVRDAVVETPRGYEFQFRPENVSVAELAEWVVAESKCCPFFYFHIDLEKEGRLVCLGLTGPEGVKAFIRGEFAVKDGK